VGVGSRFLVLRSSTSFRRYRGRRVPFSCFVLPDTFSLVPRASCLIFMFCAPGLIFTVLRASGPIFLFCAPELIFGVTEGVGSRFHVLRSRTRFRRYRGRRVPCSCFALLDSFSTVPRVLGLVFMFCAPGLVSTVPTASGPVFMFCAPELVFSVTEGVGFRFHILHSRIRFRRYHGRFVLFSCFSLPDMFSAVPRASGPVFIFPLPNSFLIVPRASNPVFMFSAPGDVFGGTEGVGSRFHVLRTRTHF
jgi:hypothetical protein